MICGYEEKGKPYIISIFPPGVADDHTSDGIAAIGVGGLQAIGRLLFVDHKRSDRFAHTLFDCFDAKANAELTPWVGYEWDACFVMKDRVRFLKKGAHSLIDRAWAQRSRSPFKKIKEPDDLDDPPEGWEDRLHYYVEDSVGFIIGESGGPHAEFIVGGEKLTRPETSEAKSS
jgi:hypothetical protein